MGLGVITLDALARREWVKEDELAAEIKVHPKVLRRVLRYLEQARLFESDCCATTSLQYPSLHSWSCRHLLWRAAIACVLK